MTDSPFQEIAVRDPRIAPHASGTQAAWLWSSDGATILWANAAGAATLGLRNPGLRNCDAIGEPLGPADPHRRQVAQLALHLPRSGAARLERMRGFGATPGQLATCSCTWLAFDDGSAAILIASLVNSPRPLPLAERLQFIIDGFDRPAVAFSAEGALLAANRAAKIDLVHIEQFSSADFASARGAVLRGGRSEASLGGTSLALYRIGAGHEMSLVALLPATLATAERVTTTPAATPSAPESDELPVDEAFADEVLVDEDPPAEDATTMPPSSPPPIAEPAVPAPVAARNDFGPVPAPSTDVQPGSAVVAPDETASGKHPLRFLWQMDAVTRFSLGSDDFSKLIGPLAAAALGRPWQEIADHFRIDPDHLIAKAVASRQTWSGIVIDWPMSEAGDRMPIELSGLPIFDRARNFAGYRGFGICRDAAGLERLADLRRQESLFGTVHPTPAPVKEAQPDLPANTVAAPAHTLTVVNEIASVDPVRETAAPSNGEAPPPQNVVPFRPASDARAPALSAVENHAFDEIARRLSARLDRIPPDGDDDAEHDHTAQSASAATGPAPAALNDPARLSSPAWLGATTGAPRGDSERDKPLLDRVPVGVLIYRLDRLLYANTAFLERTGFASLHTLSEAGGLDALYVQPLEPSASSSSEHGMPLSIATSATGDMPVLARLYTISWDGEPAMALIFSADAQTPDEQPQVPQRILNSAAAAATQDPRINDDLASIIEATADGIVMFDQQGNILSCNRSAEALFNEGAARLTHRHLADLFAPESQAVVLAYVEGLDGPTVTSLMDHGREVLGQAHGGGVIPLSMTMGRSGDGKLFAVFRDLSQLKKNEADLLNARRSAERAATSKADVLAKISHEIRIPLNAIIGFAEAMLEQRLGPVGTERYLDYMRDIRAAGERVLAIVNDMLNLSRIETGKLDLTPANVNLNDLVAQCVGVLQPQANRERIIIRSSLAHHLPVVVADAQSLRQIVSNLIASSIQLASPSGQVIVSTALTDDGEVALRVRDTGRGLSESDLKAAVAPYRGSTDDYVVPDTASVNLSLTKALTEANRAQFHIRKAPQAGTLIEVIFRMAGQAAAGG